MFYANVFTTVIYTWLIFGFFAFLFFFYFTPVVQSVTKISPSGPWIDCEFLFLTFSVIFSVYVIPATIQVWVISYLQTVIGEDTSIQEKLKLWLAFNPKLALICFWTTGSKGCTVVESSSRHILHNLQLTLECQCPRIFLLNKGYPCGFICGYLFNLFSRFITFFTFLNFSFKRKRTEMSP